MRAAVSTASTNKTIDFLFLFFCKQHPSTLIEGVFCQSFWIFFSLLFSLVFFLSSEGAFYGRVSVQEYLVAKPPNGSTWEMPLAAGLFFTGVCSVTGNT